MLSRVADSLYWMSRYMERADGILRMLKINYAASQDLLTSFRWEPVLQVFSTASTEEISQHAANTRSVLQHMLFDRQHPNSVINIVTHARENGRSVQDHITKEMWQCLNDYYHKLRDPEQERRLETDDPIAILDTFIREGMLYFGTTDVTMARGEGSAFINLGKYLERALQTTDILDVKFLARDDDSTGGSDTTYWKYFLLSISGYELYLKTYRSGLEALPVVEQTLLSPQFPRSVLYAINRLHRYFEQLVRLHPGNDQQELAFLIGKTRSHIQFSTTQTIFEEGLHAYLQRTRAALYAIGTSLNQTYFAYL